jgi:sirohydrochlorin ferrochelatase
VQGDQMMQGEAILVAHGSPADPVPQEAVMKALAVRVAMFRPGWVVRGTTLAMPDALEETLSRLHKPLIYPFFMAEGWFTKVNLPRRLKAAGAEDLAILPPFGVDPALPDLMAEAAAEAAKSAGFSQEDTRLLIAAHGSKVSRSSADSTYAMAQELRARTGFSQISCGFVEEAPFLAEAATGLGRAICLPFFALSAGHVVGDVPEALKEASFDGPLLPPIGEHPQAAPLIAKALLAYQRAADRAPQVPQKV